VFVDEFKATSEVHSIPGNHDARNVGILHFQSWKNFKKFFHIKNHRFLTSVENQSMKKSKIFSAPKSEILRDFRAGKIKNFADVKEIFY